MTDKIAADAIRDALADVRIVIDEITNAAESAAEPALEVMKATRAQLGELNALISELRASMVDKANLEDLRKELEKLNANIEEAEKQGDKEILERLSNIKESIEQSLKTQEALAKCLELLGPLAGPPDEESKSRGPFGLPDDVSEQLRDATTALADAASEHKVAAQQLQDAAQAVRDIAPDLRLVAESARAGSAGAVFLPGGTSADLVQFTDGLGAARRATEELRIATRDAFGDIENEAEFVFRRIEGFIVRTVETGKAEWRELARIAIDMIRRIVLEQINASRLPAPVPGVGFPFPIPFPDRFGLFGGGSSGGGFGLGSPTLGVSTHAFAEHGGRVATGVPVLVGEAGPELFVPPMPGEIIPNDRLGGFGGGEIVNHFHYNIDARGADVGVEQRIRRALQETEKRAVDRAKYEIFNDARRGGIFSRLSHRR